MSAYVRRRPDGRTLTCSNRDSGRTNGDSYVFRWHPRNNYRHRSHRLVCAQSVMHLRECKLSLIECFDAPARKTKSEEKVGSIEVHALH